MPLFKHHNQSGFTLIDALIAAFVVGCGLLGLAKLQSVFFKGNAESRTQTAALHFAQQKIESLRRFSSQTDFDNILGTPGSTISDSDSCDPSISTALAANQEIICTGISETLNRDWSITDCPDALSCRKLTVTINWANLDGTAHLPLILETFITRNEPVDIGAAIAN